MTEQANPKLEAVENLFKEAVWDTLVQAGMTAFFAQYPALKIWPVGPMLTYLVNLFSENLYGALKLAIDVKAIAFVNEEHKRAFDIASVTLKIIAYDRGIDSDEFRKARENAKEALARFVHFGG